MLGKIEYGIEQSSYKTNLNNLILGVAGLARNEQRTDWRHNGSVKLIQVVTEQIVFQENETDPLLYFLNYTHTIATLTLKGEY